MPKRKRASSEDHDVLADPDELDDVRVGEVENEVGLFAGDYGRFQRSRSDIPPPLVARELGRDAARRR